MQIWIQYYEVRVAEQQIILIKKIYTGSGEGIMEIADFICGKLANLSYDKL